MKITLTQINNNTYPLILIATKNEYFDRINSHIELTHLKKKEIATLLDIPISKVSYLKKRLMQKFNIDELISYSCKLRNYITNKND